MAAAAASAAGNFSQLSFPTKNDSNGARATADVEPGGVDRDAIEARLGAAGRPICAAHRRPPGTAGQRARYSSVKNKTVAADGNEHSSADCGVCSALFPSFREPRIECLLRVHQIFTFMKSWRPDWGRFLDILAACVVRSHAWLVFF